MTQVKQNPLASMSSPSPLSTADQPIVLTGASGLVGSAFAVHLDNESLLVPPRALLDVSSADELDRFLDANAPRLVINCAADTDVEAAENDPERSFAVNADLAERLARGAARVGARFVHFSSTGCYGNGQSAPFTEADPLFPTTVHHKSKAEGEERVRSAMPDALILRLGWIFGGRPGQRKNFVWGRLLEAQAASVMKSDPAQIGSPTFAGDVVRQTLHLLSRHASGTFNCVNDGSPASRLEYVTAILAAANLDIPVEPVEFRRRASVSPNEAAINARLSSEGLNVMPPWRGSLTDYVQSLMHPSVQESDI